MNALFDAIKVQRLESYRALYDALIQRLQEAGFVVTALRGYGDRADEVLPLNPMGTYTPQNFNPRYIKYRGVQIEYKGMTVKIAVDEDTLLGEANIWCPISRHTKRYYERNYPKEFAAGRYSMYCERSRTTRSPSLDVLIDRIKKMVDKATKTLALREKEVAAGKGQQLGY